MQTNQPIKESAAFTAVSNLKINPPTGTVLSVASIVLGFSLYLTYIFSCANRSMHEEVVPIISSNYPLDSIKVVSPGMRRVNMILTGKKSTDTIHLEANKAYEYTFKIPQKIEGEEKMVEERVTLYPSLPNTLMISDSWKTISGKGEILRSELIFVEYPYLLMWAILISLLNAVSWTVGIYFIYLTIQYLKQMEVPARRKTWVVLLAVVTVVLYFILTMNHDTLTITYRELCSAFDIIFKSEQVDTLFRLVTLPTEVCGVMAAGILLLLPFLSYYALENPKLIDADKKISAQKVIRDDFVLLVTFMSGLILFGLITNGLMYQVLMNVLGTDFQYLMPKEFTIIYGLKYSIILAIFYFPVYFCLQKARETLRQELLISGTSTTELDTHLGSTRISAKFWDRFKIITAALTPLLGSIGIEFIKLITDLH